MLGAPENQFSLTPAALRTPAGGKRNFLSVDPAVGTRAAVVVPSRIESRDRGRRSESFHRRPS
jgi:hypothetical protein